jgi:hypothetical protein
MRLFLRAAVILVSLSATACTIDRRNPVPLPAVHRLVIDRELDESMRGEVSKIVEHTAARLTWLDEERRLSGTFEIDSVRFTRDGLTKSVAPSGEPIARFVFHTTPAGDFVLDSLPRELVRYPYLATIALELPLLRPRIGGRLCTPGSSWSDSIRVGPVPVPGVDSLFSTYRTQYRVSAPGESLALVGETEITRSGRTQGRVVLTERQTRVSTWRLASDCLGPATLSETRRVSIVYPSVHRERPDTVLSTGRRSILASQLTSKSASRLNDREHR